MRIQWARYLSFFNPDLRSRIAAIDHNIDDFESAKHFELRRAMLKANGDLSNYVVARTTTLNDHGR